MEVLSVEEVGIEEFRVNNRIVLALVWVWAGVMASPATPVTAPGEDSTQPRLRVGEPLPSESLGLPQQASTTPAAEPGRLAAEKLSRTDQVSLWQALSKARREIRRPTARQAASDTHRGVHFQASNPGQELAVRFLSSGARVVSARADREWQATLRLADLPETTEVAATDTRLEYRRGSVIEWYENRPDGIEHGFILEERPADAGEELRLAIAVDGLKARASETTPGSLDLVDADGNSVLGYGGLKVWDADGTPVAARLEPLAEGIGIVVADAGARYPLTIDPLITSLQAKLGPDVLGSGAAGDLFGNAVDISGDYAVVGAYHDNNDGNNSGSAYVFARSGATWTVQGKLIADDGAASDYFGHSVSISGDSVIVGAYSDDDDGSTSGSAYVFTRSGAVWTQQQKLTADDAALGDWFGWSVSISGDSVIVGARGDDDAGSGSGSAYVFTRSGAAWTQQQKLTAGDAAAGDTFSYSVSIDGDSVIVGAYGNDDNGSNSGSAYVFTRSGVVWTEQQKLTAGDAAAGDQFGYSASISGDSVIVGAPYDDDDGDYSGSAYVFARSGIVWTEQQKLTAADAAATDAFGMSVSISGDSVIVSAHADDDDGENSGSAYVLTRSGATWTPQQKLTAGDGAVEDELFYSVSSDGDSVCVGPPYDDDNGSSSGSAYVFTRSGVTWSQQQKLTAADAAAGDYFGCSVSISGDSVIVGAQADADAGSYTGSAYVFTRSGATWTQQQKLTAADAAGGDWFGYSVSIDGDSVIVGAFADDDSGTSSGSAYVFVRSGVTWTEQQKLTASDAATGDAFGWSVSVSGDSVIVGAQQNDDAGSSSGSAYVFTRSGATWTQQQKLTAADAAANDKFGLSVSISGDSVIVGAPKNQDNGLDSGSVYIFTRSGATWTQDQKLIAGDGAAGDRFGQAVSISGDSMIVGAYVDDGLDAHGGPSVDQGSAYIYAEAVVPVVASHMPNTNALNIAASNNIAVTFSEIMDAGTVDTDSFVVNGSLSGPITGSFSVVGGVVALDPTVDFEIGELVTVTLTTNLQNWASQSLQAPYIWQFFVQAPYGHGMFRDSGQTLAGTFSGGVKLGDLDGDGDLDAFIASAGLPGGAPNKVYLNNGAGVFTDSGQSLGSEHSFEVELGDVDGDGDLDAFMPAWTHANKIWLNNGSGIFTDSGQDLGGSGNNYGGCLADVDGDGDLDAYVPLNNGGDEVWLNNGSGVFSDSGQSLGSASSIRACMADVDGDGDLDAFSPPKLWINDGSGTFSDSGQTLGGNQYGPHAGDVDGDGDVDFFCRSYIYVNDGTGTFSQGQALENGDIRDTVLVDIDADGDLDAVSSIGNIWLNDGSGVFSSTASGPSNPTRLYELDFGDLDGDGDLDAYAVHDGIDRVWLNQALDFGDLPAAYNLSTEAGNGARHELPQTGSITLGTVIDGETNGFESATALGDDGDGTDDEDGVTVSGDWLDGAAGGAVQIVVTGGSGYLSAWIDWDGNSQFTDSGDQVLNMVAVSAGTQTNTFDIPVGTIPVSGTYTNFARFRLWTNSTPALTTTGLVLNGEVEDHQLVFTGAAPPVVASHTPNTNALNIAAGTNIAVTFSENMDAGTVDADSFNVDGTISGPVTGSFSVVGGVVTLDPATNLHIGETITVMLTTDLQSAAGASLASPFAWQFTVVAPLGYGNFVDSGQSYGTPQGWGPALGDLDGDGDIDAFVGNRAHGDTVWTNDGTGVLSDSGQALGSYDTINAALGDLDGDGDLDAFSANQGQADKVWLNDGTGTFSDSGQSLGGADASYSVSLGDLDGDGDLDAAVASTSSTNYTWMNDGSGTFSLGSALGGSAGTKRIALGDLDGDGDLDAFVGQSPSHEVYFNNGSGIFSDSGQLLASSSTREVALGDVDGDGDLDAFMGNGSNQPNKIWLNDGSGTFSDSGQSLGNAITFAVSLGDLDADGDLDAFAANYSGQANKVWINNGSGTFTDSGLSLGSATSVGCALADLDSDGDLDAFVGNITQTDRVWLNRGIDFGDLPAAYNLSTQSDNGARHEIPNTGRITLGATIDAEIDGIEIAAAAGDDGDKTDDEDGVTVLGNWQEGTAGGAVRVVVSGGPGYLSAWIDWDGNSQFTDSGDQVLNMVAVSAGTQTNTFDIPVGTIPVSGTYTNFARFRLWTNSTPALTTTGLVLNGEVEDHQLVFTGAAPPVVASHTPNTNAVNIAASNDIVVTFTENMGAGTVSNDSFNVDGTISGLITGSFSVAGGVVTLDPAADFHIGEVVTVTLTTNLESSAGAALARPYIWRFVVDSPYGPGSFTPEETIASNLVRTWELDAADMDDDGDIDVVSISQTSNRVVWLENDGTGSYTMWDISSTFTNARSVCAADLDEDGDMDVIVGTDGALSWFENDGSENFTEHAVPGGGGMHSVQVVDMDGDGDMDILWSGYHVVWHENDGSEGFTAHTIYLWFSGAWIAYPAHAADIDSDGDMDVTCGFYHNRLHWYENDGSQNFAQHVIRTGIGRSEDIVATDVDGDGDIDIVYAEHDHTGSPHDVRWEENDGNQNFTAHVIWQQHLYYPASLSVVDYDSDGDVDVFAGMFSVYGHPLYLFENDGSQSFTTIELSAKGATKLDVADVDGDGDLDLLTADFDYDTLRLFRQTALDWGDLPAAYSLTELVDDGARHDVPNTGAIHLGTVIDGDSDGQESADAGRAGTDGDDGDGTDDEDGIVVVGNWYDGMGGGRIQVTVTGGSGYLSGWIDWDGNNQFTDPGDQVLNMAAVSAGTQAKTFNIPAGAIPLAGAYTNFARFRLWTNSIPVLTTTGSVHNGEIEDYRLEIQSVGVIQPPTLFIFK